MQVINLIDSLPRTAPWPDRTCPISAIIIHHTAASIPMSPETIANSHMDPGRHLVMPGIAYHYYIAWNGVIFQCNPDSARSWHAGSGQTGCDNPNEYGIGVCLSGCFTEQREPTDAQLEAARYVVALLRQRYGALDVLGHQDVAQTACPGDTWPSWRDRLDGGTIPPEVNTMGTKLGGHYQKPSDEALAWYAKALPPAIKVMGNVGPSDLQPILDTYARHSMPRPFVVARVWTDDRRDEWVNAGAAGARLFYDATIAAYERWRGIATAVEGINEYIPWSEDHMKRLNEFDQEAAQLFQMHGLPYVCGNFSVGWPDLSHWPLYRDALEASAYLGLHEYWWPGLPDDGYRALRYRRAIERMQDADIDVPPILITELGWDRALLNSSNGNIGFRLFGKEDEYLQWLIGYDAQTMRDDEVKASFIFQVGAAQDWKDKGFDIVGSSIAFDLAEYIRGNNDSTMEPADPEPPEEGTSVIIKAYDWQGNEMTVEALQAVYGFIIKPAIAEPGQEVFRLSAIREKYGDAAQIAKVRRGDGPDVGRAVAWYWPDAPQSNPTPTAHDWEDNYLIAVTNENGEVGPGMGTGAYHDAGTPGPHAMWVLSPSAPSDAVYGLGMIVGTDHHHVDLEWTLVVEPESEPEEPETPEPGENPATAIRWNAEEAMRELEAAADKIEAARARIRDNVVAQLYQIEGGGA